MYCFTPLWLIWITISSRSAKSMIKILQRKSNHQMLQKLHVWKSYRSRILFSPRKNLLINCQDVRTDWPITFEAFSGAKNADSGRCETFKIMICERYETPSKNVVGQNPDKYSNEMGQWSFGAANTKIITKKINQKASLLRIHRFL